MEHRRLKQILDDMSACVGRTDKEDAHRVADDLLVETIRKAADTVGIKTKHQLLRLVELYESVGKWYA